MEIAKIKQTAYLPVKVEDELPEIGRAVFTSNEEIDTCSFLSTNGKFKEWYQHFEHEPTHWLKPQEGYFFTPEQLNELLSNVIKDTLEVGAEEAKTYPKEEYNEREGIYEYPLIISKKSITNQHSKILEKWKV